MDNLNDLSSVADSVGNFTSSDNSTDTSTSSTFTLDLNSLAQSALGIIAQKVNPPPGGKVTSSTNTAPSPDWASLATSIKNSKPFGLSPAIVYGGLAVALILGVMVVRGK